VEIGRDRGVPDNSLCDGGWSHPDAWIPLAGTVRATFTMKR